jgi:hypothetical protein
MDQWSAKRTPGGVCIAHAYDAPPGEGSIEETPLDEKRGRGDTRVVSIEAGVFPECLILRVDSHVTTWGLRQVVTRHGRVHRTPGVSVDRLTAWHVFNDVDNAGEAWLRLRVGGRLPTFAYSHKPRLLRCGPYQPRIVTRTLICAGPFTGAHDARWHDIATLKAMGIPVSPEPMDAVTRARLRLGDLIPAMDPATAALAQRALDKALEPHNNARNG